MILTDVNWNPHRFTLATNLHFMVKNECFNNIVVKASLSPNNNLIVSGCEDN